MTPFQRALATNERVLEMGRNVYHQNDKRNQMALKKCHDGINAQIFGLNKKLIPINK